ncbi:hypothetical protein, partial [Escherichia coli]|uniref:hypothetical protein n=1 Tax=Escherichia coli TaxID=562 RepID=UPI001A9200DE
KRVFLVILFTSFSGSLVSRIPGAVHSDKERSVCSSDMGNMGGIIFSFFTWGCVFAVLVDPEAKESAIYLQTKKFGRKRPTRIFSIRGYFNRSQLKYSVTLWSVLAA